MDAHAQTPEFKDAWPDYASAAAVIAAILEKEKQAFELYKNAIVDRSTTMTKIQPNVRKDYT